MIYVMKLDERLEYELPDGSRITLAEIVALRKALPEDAEPKDPKRSDPLP